MKQSVLLNSFQRRCGAMAIMTYRISGIRWKVDIAPRRLVQKKLLDLREAVPEDHPIQYIQKIDNVLFCHGGLLNYFVEEYVSKSKYDDVDQVVKIINKLGRREMWNQGSPIWLRPQNSRVRLYKPRKLLQVVGHTPMTEITREGNVISCDVFSTYRDGRPIGTQEFLLLDTQTWEYCGVKLH